MVFFFNGNISNFPKSGLSFIHLLTFFLWHAFGFMRLAKMYVKGFFNYCHKYLPAMIIKKINFFY